MTDGSSPVRKTVMHRALRYGLVAAVFSPLYLPGAAVLAIVVGDRSGDQWLQFGRERPGAESENDLFGDTIWSSMTRHVVPAVVVSIAPPGA